LYDRTLALNTKDSLLKIKKHMVRKKRNVVGEGNVWMRMTEQLLWTLAFFDYSMEEALWEDNEYETFG